MCFSEKKSVTELWDELATVNCELYESMSIEDDGEWYRTHTGLVSKRKGICQQIESITGDKVLDTPVMLYGRPSEC